MVVDKSKIKLPLEMSRCHVPSYRMWGVAQEEHNWKHHSDKPEINGSSHPVYCMSELFPARRIQGPQMLFCAGIVNLPCIPTFCRSRPMVPGKNLQSQVQLERIRCCEIWTLIFENVVHM